MSHKTYTSLLSELTLFNTQITSFLQDLDILEACQQLTIDHIALQAGSERDGYLLSQELVKSSVDNQVLATTQVNGRQIDIIEVKESVKVLEQDISIIELLFPKPDQKFSTSHWTHLEFLLPAEYASLTLEEALEHTFGEEKIRRNKSLFQYKASTPQVEGVAHNPNSTVSFSNNEIAIKFHFLSLQATVENELNILNKKKKV